MSIFAICGREGSGKSTIANYIAPLGEVETIQFIPCSKKSLGLDQIVMIMFSLKSDNLNERDLIWNLNYDEACVLVMKLIRENIDSEYSINDFTPLKNIFEVYNSDDKPWFIKEAENNPNYKGWSFDAGPAPGEKEKPMSIQMSFADPLKKIAAIVFGFDYKMLLGIDSEMRKLRETIKSRKYNIMGEVTGRQCLELFGTEVWRHKFDQDVWVKILKRDASSAIEMGNYVVIPDLRFPNEKLALDALGGTLLCVYRNSTELVLTPEDKLTHPAKWKFLDILNDKNDENQDKKNKTIMIHNNGTLDELYKQIDLLL